jgi:thioredoxin-dependent peroxiredoxin
VRELREFRVHHPKFVAAGLPVAGISLDDVEANRRWRARLELPYPLLADPGRRACEAFGVLRRIGIGGWNIEMLNRSTFLADRRGIVAAVWGRVKVRGHAEEVLAAALALESDTTGEWRVPTDRPPAAPR